MKPSDDLAERLEMVERQIRRRGVVNEAVLNAMRRTPRHLFVPPDRRSDAYQDGALDIGEGQTISQPYMVALMTALLELQSDERVLDVGTGSGYQAAVLSPLAAEVHTIERRPNLAHVAQARLDELGYHNVTVHMGDGSLGLPAYAPYNAILVAAGAPYVPQALLAQLAEGGRLVLPVGNLGGQVLQRWRRHGEVFEHEDLIPVVFVPLTGAQGWSDTP